MSYILSKSPAYKASCQFHIPSDGVIVEQPYEWGIPLKLRFCVVWRLGQESIFYILFRQIKFSNVVAREKKTGFLFSRRRHETSEDGREECTRHCHSDLFSPENDGEEEGRSVISQPWMMDGPRRPYPA
jgi:hypothetical protein